MTGAGGGRKDLYVLTADADMKATMEALLPRYQSLGIRQITFTVERHVQHDPGCRLYAARWLQPFRSSHSYALVMFDRHGSGTGDRLAIQTQVEAQLGGAGWQARSKAIVIDPELETWVWNTSPWTSKVLGWHGKPSTMRTWLERRGLWPANRVKPPAPKRAMKAVLRETRVRHSPTVFGDLARQVGTRGCQDPAFADLRSTLRQWFP